MKINNVENYFVYEISFTDEEADKVEELDIIGKLYDYQNEDLDLIDFIDNEIDWVNTLSSNTLRIVLTKPVIDVVERAIRLYLL